MIVGGRIVYAEVDKKSEEQATGLNINVSVDEVLINNGMLDVKYTYTATYEKDVGTLKIIGYIEVQDDNEQKIAEEWKKSQKIPDELSEELLNAINFTCGVNGTLICRALNMAPPMVLPRIQINKKG